jgi:hypothetical protein
MRYETPSTRYETPQCTLYARVRYRYVRHTETCIYRTKFHFRYFKNYFLVSACTYRVYRCYILTYGQVTENINQTNSQSTRQDHRILNLEKANKRQEQKSNEIFKHLKRNVKNQKNFKGSRQPESSATLIKQTLNKNKRRPTPKIVDLTLDNNERLHQGHLHFPKT